MLLLFLAAFGAYALACWLYENVFSSLFGIIWYSVKQLICGRKSLTERYGKWAVITGATDGIGKGYAVHLARRGVNLVLISRSEEKLMKVTREIQDAFGVQIKRIVVDFSDGPSIYSRIRKELLAVEVGFLVNNVGIAPERLEAFEDHSEQQYMRMVNVNILSVLMMTHMVLPRMKMARRGIIINVSSASAYFPAPYLSMYSGTKAFGHNLTLALQQELRGTGVECQLVAPQFVRTNMTDTWNVTRFGGKLVPDGNAYGRWATSLIGKTEHTSGHWYHALQLLLSRTVPPTLWMKILRAVYSNLKLNQGQQAKSTEL